MNTQEFEKLLFDSACEDIAELKERLKEYHALCIFKAKLDKIIKDHLDMKVTDFDTLNKIHTLIKNFKVMD